MPPAEFSDEIDPSRLARVVAQPSRSPSGIYRLQDSFRDVALLSQAALQADSPHLVDDVLNYLYQRLREALPFDRMSIVVLDAKAQQMRVWWARTEAEKVRLNVGYTASLSHGSLAGVLATGQPRAINDLQAYVLANPQSRETALLVAEGMRSGLTCPLITKSGPVGFMFFNSTEVGAYTPAHLDAYAWVAVTLAELVEHGRSHEATLVSLRRTERATQEQLTPVSLQTWNAERRSVTKRVGEALVSLAATTAAMLHEARALADITAKVNAGLTLDQTLDFIYDEFRAILPYERIAFAMVEDDETVVRARWARWDHGPDSIGGGYALPLAETSLGDVLQSGRPRILADLDAYLVARPASDATQLMVRDGYRSSLTCPLQVLGKNLGFLFFASREANAYTSVHVDSYLRIADRVATMVEKGRLFQEKTEAHARTEALLHNILPKPIAARLYTSTTIVDTYESATVLFADIVGFTSWAKLLDPRETVELLNHIFSDFDDLTERHGVEKIKMMGDAYMLAGGLPAPTTDHPSTVTACALDMVAAAGRYALPDGSPITVRIGVHTGPVAAGVLGRLKFRYDVWGDTVNTASRIESNGVPGQVLVSSATRARLDERFATSMPTVLIAKGIGDIPVWHANWYQPAV